MNPFWSNLFYDMNEYGLTQECIAGRGGADIREELRRVEDKIRQLKPLEALELLAELKKYV